MSPSDFPYKLYLVTDESLCMGRDFFWMVEEAIKGGAEIIQLREKNLDLEDFVRKAEKLKVLCEKYKVPLIINDSVEVARQIDAQGLHIGQEDTGIIEARNAFSANKPLGLSLEKLEDLYKPHSSTAWYYGVSPIYATPTKTDTKTEWGLRGLSYLRKVTEKPLVAIGRIKCDNAASIISHGADCLAVVSGICSAPSPAHAAEAFRKEIERGSKQKLW
jgi:thiamine-phosphate pyrophosphorylase